MSTDTGAALAAAIRAAPDDDAPWLVYADWLQEAGRDAEAQAIRAHLPALREPVRAGHEVVEVVATAAVHPPGDPGWELMFGRPPAAADDFVDALPTRPEPAPWQVERPAERRVEGTGLQFLFVPVMIGFVILARVALNPPAPPVVPILFPDGGRLTPSEAWKVRAARSQVPASELTPAQRKANEVVGHTFGQVAGGGERRTLDFGSDGKVLLGSDRTNIVIVHKWSVGEDGVIDIADYGSRLLARLVLARVLGRVYAGEWNGRPELYVREQ